MSTPEQSNRSEIQTERPQQGGDLTAAGSLEKVRDILFGTQAREYERRFSRLEDRLIKEAVDMRDEMKKRFDSLELFVKQEIELLNERLRTEQKDRNQASDELSFSITELAKSFEKKSTQIEEHLSTSNKQLREQLLEQYKNLMDEILQKHKALTASLEREAKELRIDKVDRFALASMFNEFALRLNDELVIPIPEESTNG